MRFRLALAVIAVIVPSLLLSAFPVKADEPPVHCTIDRFATWTTERACKALMSIANDLAAHAGEQHQIQRCVILLDEWKQPPRDPLDICEKIVAGMAPPTRLRKRSAGHVGCYSMAGSMF
jgi:hypothetical protein